LPSGADYPQIAITGYFTLGGTNNGPQPRKDQTYQVTDNFSWNKDGTASSSATTPASSKYGIHLRRPTMVVSHSRKAVLFRRGSWTRFLLGVPNTYAQGSGSIIIADAYEHYAYAQDQWRIKDTSP